MEKVSLSLSYKPGISSLYSLARGIRNALRYQRTVDEWGFCNICGNYSIFRFEEVISPKSRISISCEWDEQFTRVINACNTMNCSWCRSKFRVRSACNSLLRVTKDESVRSLFQLLNKLRTGKLKWRILETASSDGIFSNVHDISSIIKTEYFDNIPRGEIYQGIQSEDLQKLSFSSESFDIVVSLDVFEHIADPWQAFLEVYRVLKVGGVGIITVPIDRRLMKTRVRAQIIGEELRHIEQPAYHSDPLRAEGALVFTDFGMDIIEQLKKYDITAKLYSYFTVKRKFEQFVIVVEKNL